MEQLHYNLLYRWFVGLGVDEPVWVPTVFAKNRERMLEAEVAHKFLTELLNHKQVRGLLSDEHFSVDGTQVAAWASIKSFRAKDGSDEPPSGGRNGERDLQGERGSNDTHASTTAQPNGSSVPQNTSNRTSTIDARTTRHPGYAISRHRKPCRRRSAGCRCRLRFQV